MNSLLYGTGAIALGAAGLVAFLAFRHGLNAPDIWILIAAALSFAMSGVFLLGLGRGIWLLRRIEGHLRPADFEMASLKTCSSCSASIPWDAVECPNCGRHFDRNQIADSPMGRRYGFSR